MPYVWRESRTIDLSICLPKGAITDDCALQLCDFSSINEYVQLLGVKSYLPFIGVITPGKEEGGDVFLFGQ